MARPAPGPVPAVIPHLSTVAGLLTEVVMARDPRLKDAAIYHLVDVYGKGTVHVVGSTVWMPAVYGLPPPTDTDIDLVFSDPAACAHAVLTLLKRCPEAEMERTKHGGARVRVEGQKVLDAWLLNDASIGELLLSFPYPHQRVAYAIGNGAGCGPDRITRLVRPVSKESFDRDYHDFDDGARL